MAIIIPALNETRPEPMKIGFNKLSKATKARSFGFVPNPEEFSSPAGFERYDGSLYSQVIKVPGSDYVISEGFRNFIPTIRRIIEAEHSKPESLGSYVSLLAFQRIVQPEPNAINGYFTAHRDIELDSILRYGSSSDMHLYAVADSLPTGFIDYNFTKSDLDELQRSSNSFETQSDILLRNAKVFQNFSAYEIAGFDGLTPHAMMSPAEPTRRTFMSMAFLAADQEILDLTDTNNPELDDMIRSNVGRNNSRTKFDCK